jgi:hypothetical protein
LARRSDLDGPRLTYGGPAGAPVREPRRVPASTLVLLGVCLLLAVLLTVSLTRGRSALQQVQASPTAAPATPPASPAPGPATPASASPSVDPSGSDAGETTVAPVAATETASRFVDAWLDRDPKTRTPALQQVAAPGLVEQLQDVDPAKLPKARPVGVPKPGLVSEGSASLQQSLSDRSVVSLELAADPDSRYGWLVYSVSPGTGG